MTQDATQFIQVPGRVADETLLNRSRCRVLLEDVSLGIIFHDIAPLDCHHNSLRELVSRLDNREALRSMEVGTRGA